MESHPAYIKVGALFNIRIMNNMVNSGSLATLKPGQVLAVHARKVANGKIEVEIAEVLQQSGSAGINLVKLANKGDDRFASRGARRAWLTGTPEGLSEMFGVDFTSLTYTVDERGREISPLNILSPVISIEGAAGTESHALAVQVTETIEPNEWQALNFETAAKRRGADGPICTHQGKAIFANTSVVIAAMRSHTFLAMDTVQQVTGVGAVNTDTGEIFN